MSIVAPNIIPKKNYNNVSQTLSVYIVVNCCVTVYGNLVTIIWQINYTYACALKYYLACKVYVFETIDCEGLILFKSEFKVLLK